MSDPVVPPAADWEGANEIESQLQEHIAAAPDPKAQILAFLQQFRERPHEFNETNSAAALCYYVEQFLAQAAPVVPRPHPCIPHPDFREACDLPGGPTFTSLDSVERCKLCGCPSPSDSSAASAADRVSALTSLVEKLQALAPHWSTSEDGIAPMPAEAQQKWPGFGWFKVKEVNAIRDELSALLDPAERPDKEK